MGLILIILLLIAVFGFSNKSSFAPYLPGADTEWTSDEHYITPYWSFPYLDLSNPDYWNSSKNYYDKELSRNWHRFNENRTM